jgi:chromosome partitioning protein
MTTTIAMLNQKGGVTKTTSTLNFAAELSQRGLRVLCVDMDPQGNLTTAAGYGQEVPPDQSVLAALLPEEFHVDPAAITVSAPWGGCLWRASQALLAADSYLMSSHVQGPQQRLRVALADHAGGFDMVLVDPPPSIGKLTANSLVAADFLLVPTDCSEDSLRGLGHLFSTLKEVAKYEHRDPQILGVFAAKKRNTRSHTEAAEIIADLPDGLGMTHAIPLAQAVEDAKGANMPISAYEPSNPAAVAYSQLTDEILDRLATNGIVFDTSAKAAA